MEMLNGVNEAGITYLYRVSGENCRRRRLRLCSIAAFVCVLERCGSGGGDAGDWEMPRGAGRDATGL